MCSTPWCFGDCEECEADRELEKEYEEANAECPHRKECNVCGLAKYRLAECSNLVQRLVAVFCQTTVISRFYSCLV